MISANPTAAPETDSDVAEKEQQAFNFHYYHQYLREYELLIEFKNLRNPHHCPTGLYVKPSEHSMHEWHGVMFIHRGYYKEGVFKFIMTIPDTYPAPDSPPEIRFITDMFHPLIDSKTGLFSLRQQFPTWRPRKDYLCHVLHYMKNAFKEAVLAHLQESNCLNKDAYNMFITERTSFAKLASQCAQLSSSLDMLFDPEAPTSIDFSQLTDEEFEKIKAQVMNGPVDEMTLGADMAKWKNEDHVQNTTGISGLLSKLLLK